MTCGPSPPSPVPASYLPVRSDLHKAQNRFHQGSGPLSCPVLGSVLATYLETPLRVGSITFHQAREEIAVSSPILRYFEYTHLPEPLKVISEKIYQVAWALENMIPDGAEKSAGLRKLLEAKDCFVRAALPAAPAYPLIQPPAGTDFVREQMSREAIASVKLDGETSTLDQGTDARAPEANPWGLTPQELDKVFPAVKVVKEVPLTTIEVAYDQLSLPRENYKHSHVIKGRCYGPVIVLDGKPGLKRAGCYFKLCEWMSENFGDGAKTLKELQNTHDGSESALIP